MGSGLSMGSFGLLLLFIACSMVLVSSDLFAREKMIFTFTATNARTALQMTDKFLAGSIKANGATIVAGTAINATFDFGGCKITGGLYKGTNIIYNAGETVMSLDLTYELTETGITFTEKNNRANQMSCTPNFYPISGTPYKFALDIGIQLSQSIPGMSIEYDAPPKGSYDKASGSDQKDGLDGGWIAFIVLAVLNLLVVIGCCGYWFWYRPKHKDDKDEQPVQQAN